MSEVIVGVKNLNACLDRLDKKGLRKALEKSCATVEATAKELCPVDDGQLRQSITYEVTDEVGIIGTNVEYAPYVHQGTGIYAVNGDGRKTPWSYQDAEGNWHTTKGQQPNPFLEKALDVNDKVIQDIFVEEIRSAAHG